MSEDRVGGRAILPAFLFLTEKRAGALQAAGCLPASGWGWGVQVAPATADFNQMVLTMLALRAAFWRA